MSTDTRIELKCPECDSGRICELATVEASYFISFVERDSDGKLFVEYDDSTYSDDGEFAGYYCRRCGHESGGLADFIPTTE